MKNSILIALSLLFYCNLSAQVGIGTTTPDASSALDIESTTAGMLVPRMTEAQRLVIASPATGLLVYEIDTAPGFWYFDGTVWTTFGADTDWTVVGNDMYNANTGNVGIGVTTPSAKLHIADATATLTEFFNDGFEDNTLAPFTTGGDGNWVISATNNGGSFGVDSGSINNGESNYIEVIVNVTSVYGATVSFDSFVENAADNYIEFYVNGVYEDDYNNTTWATNSYTIPSAGTYTIRWEFWNEGLNGEQGFLDNITVVAGGYNSIIRIADGNQADGRVLMSDAQGNASWKNTDDVADEDWMFWSGSTQKESDPLYRTGRVTVGSASLTTHHFNVENGLSSGTEVGIGSVEHTKDGEGETFFSNTISPLTDADRNLGSATNRWNTVFATNGTINTSDARLKEEIKPIKYGLDEVMKLKPVTYKWKLEKIGNTIVSDKDKEVKIGFLAQDLQKVISEVVVDHQWKLTDKEEDNTYVKKKSERLGVSYSEIIPVLVKAIQEQQEQIEKLKKLIRK